MADSTYRFRTSLGGYHKGDVTAYIEKAATQHRSELLECEKTISELREENRSLQQQLNLLMMVSPASTPVPTPAAEPVLCSMPEPVSSVEPMNAAELMSMELQAYRRAEAAERNANKRARKLYQQMESLCTNTIDEFHLTDAAVKETIEVMLKQAVALEQAYQTLSDTLIASQEKLAAMNELLSDNDEADDKGE